MNSNTYRARKITGQVRNVVTVYVGARSEVVISSSFKFQVLLFFESRNVRMRKTMRRKESMKKSVITGMALR